MTWGLLGVLALVHALALGAILARRASLRRLDAGLSAREQARRTGSHEARLQHPHIDLSRCIGCATCVAACPEEGVLDLIHGQASVVHGARCVGHGRCADACPVGAVALTLGDVSARTDLPAVDDSLQAAHVPGLYLAGEVTGYALVRTAIEHGRAVADCVAEGRSADAGPADDTLDLCVVGAGPAGLACSLQARARGLDFVTVEQEQLGGTVARYPRRKLVMTQPVELPLHGALTRSTYEKEDLIELWESVVAEHELPVRTGVTWTGLRREDDAFVVETNHGDVRARSVCLALGRRGTPRKLDVPGEDLPKVAYDLVDARSHRDRRILVVGGGDSAIEAALGLAEQPGNSVVLSYRKAAFFRLKARNETALERARSEGRVDVLFESHVMRIGPDDVELEARPSQGEVTRVTLPNDEVFVMVGGIPPFEPLARAGVSFDPEDRVPAPALAEQGTGLVVALGTTLLLTLGVGSLALLAHGYYDLPGADRALSDLHPILAPSSPLGLGLGVAAAFAMLANLTYLVRRSRFGEKLPGSLKHWMTVHVGTGVAALLLATVHGAFDPRDTVGGHALLGLGVLVATGAVGRYLYAFLPRAANGRELAIDELRARLAARSEDWDAASRGFGDRARDQIDAVVADRGGALPRRVAQLLGARRRLRRLVAQLVEDGRREGVDEASLRELERLAADAQRTALAAAHYEDLRGLMASWRWLHRWVALLLVALVVLHVVTAIRYGDILGAGP